MLDNLDEQMTSLREYLRELDVEEDQEILIERMDGLIDEAECVIYDLQNLRDKL